MVSITKYGVERVGLSKRGILSDDVGGGKDVGEGGDVVVICNSKLLCKLEVSSTEMDI